MTLRFTVLASGSSGNSSLVQTDSFGVLIDMGLGPRQTATRLRAIGQSWSQVQGVLLTHTHSDHWNDRTLAQLCREQIPLHCHAEHQAILLRYSRNFPALREAGLVRLFESEEEIPLALGLSYLPLPVRHDSGATFAFRVRGPSDLFGQAATLGLATDLGCWTENLADALTDVGLLAVEFNHDVQLEQVSGRSQRLISRVLSDDGHLSNEQAAELLRAILERSEPGRLQHLVQLHLSHDCNRVKLARQAARVVLEDTGCEARLHTAAQSRPGATLPVVAAPPRKVARAPRTPRAVIQQNWLPGLGPAEAG